ncbi:hypothetical protein Vafri_1861, partial [Volvox africanus]
MGSLSIMDAFRIMGPAFLVSVALVDPGNWATAIEAGSKFGYELVWVVVASNLIGILLQTLAARLGIVTGKHLAQVCRESYPSQVCALLWALCEISIVALDLTMLLGTAIGLNLLFGWPLLPCIVMTSLDALLLLLLVPAQGVRKSEALIVGPLAIVVACFLVDLLVSRPPVRSVVSGLLPRLRRDSVYTAVSLLGANVMPHKFYLHSALVSGQAAKAAAAVGGAAAAARNDYQGHIRALCLYNVLDIGAALGVALVVNVAVLLVSAATFHSAGVVVHTLQAAHDLMEQTLSSSIAPAAFGTALLCAGQLSTFTGTIAGQVVLQGFLNIHISTWLRRLVTRTAAIIPAAILQYAYGDRGTYKFLLIAQVVFALQLPVTLIPLIKATSSRQLMGCHASSRLTSVAAWAATGLVFFANLMLFMTQMLPQLSSGKGILDKDGPLDAWIDRVASLAYNDPLHAVGLLGLLLAASAFLALQLWMIITPLRVDATAPLSSSPAASNAVATADGTAPAGSSDTATLDDEGPQWEPPAVAACTRGCDSGSYLASSADHAHIEGCKGALLGEYRNGSSGSSAAGSSYNSSGSWRQQPFGFHDGLESHSRSCCRSFAAGGGCCYCWFRGGSSRSSSLIESSSRTGCMVQQFMSSWPFLTAAQTRGTARLVSNGSSRQSPFASATSDQHHSLLIMPLHHQQHHNQHQHHYHQQHHNHNQHQHHYHQQPQDQICWTDGSAERPLGTRAVATAGGVLLSPVYTTVADGLTYGAATAAAEGFQSGGGWIVPRSACVVLGAGPRLGMAANTVMPDTVLQTWPRCDSGQYNRHRRGRRSYSSASSARGSSSNGNDNVSSNSGNDVGSISHSGDRCRQTDGLSLHTAGRKRIRSAAAATGAIVVGGINDAGDENAAAAGGNRDASNSCIRSSSSVQTTVAVIEEGQPSLQWGSSSMGSASVLPNSESDDMAAVATATSTYTITTTTTTTTASGSKLWRGQQLLHPQPSAEAAMAAGEQPTAAESDKVGAASTVTAAVSSPAAATARGKHPIVRRFRLKFAEVIKRFWSTWYNDHGRPVVRTAQDVEPMTCRQSLGVPTTLTPQPQQGWHQLGHTAHGALSSVGARDTGNGGAGSSRIRTRAGLHYFSGGSGSEGGGGSVGECRGWSSEDAAVADAMVSEEAPSLVESNAALPLPSSPLVCSHAEGSHLCMGCSQALFETVRRCLVDLEKLEGVKEVMWGSWPLQWLLPSDNQTFHYHRRLLLAARYADFASLHALCFGAYSSSVDQSKLLASALLLPCAAVVLPPLSAATATAGGSKDGAAMASHSQPQHQTQTQIHVLSHQQHHNHCHVVKRQRAASAVGAASLGNAEGGNLSAVDINPELHRRLRSEITTEIWPQSFQDFRIASNPVSSSSSAAAAPLWPGISNSEDRVVLPRAVPLSPATPTVSSWCVFGPAALVSFGICSMFTMAQWCMVDTRPQLWGKYACVLNHLQGVLRDARLIVTEEVPLGAVVAGDGYDDSDVSRGGGADGSGMELRGGRHSADNQPRQLSLRPSTIQPSQPSLPSPTTTAQQQWQPRYGAGAAQRVSGCFAKAPHHHHEHHHHRHHQQQQRQQQQYQHQQHQPQQHQHHRQQQQPQQHQHHNRHQHHHQQQQPQQHQHHHHQQQQDQQPRHPQPQLSALPATALRLCPEHVKLLRRELLQQLDGMDRIVKRRHGPPAVKSQELVYLKAKNIVASVMSRYRNQLGAAGQFGGGAGGAARGWSVAHGSGGGATAAVTGGG